MRTETREPERGRGARPNAQRLLLEPSEAGGETAKLLPARKAAPSSRKRECRLRGGATRFPDIWLPSCLLAREQNSAYTQERLTHSAARLVPRGAVFPHRLFSRASIYYTKPKHIAAVVCSFLIALECWFMRMCCNFLDCLGCQKRLLVVLQS